MVHNIETLAQVPFIIGNGPDRFKGVAGILDLAEVMQSTSLCGLGKSAPNPLISGMDLFREEVEEHVFDRTCRGSDRNLRNRLKGVLDWDEKYSGIQTRENLELPVDANLLEEDFMANFAPRLIIK